MKTIVIVTFYRIIDWLGRDRELNDNLVWGCICGAFAFLGLVILLTGCAPGYLNHSPRGAPVQQCELYGGLFVGTALGSEELEQPLRQAVEHWNDRIGKQYFLWAGATNMSMHRSVPKNLVLVGKDYSWPDYHGPKSCGGVRANHILDCYVETRILIAPECISDATTLASALRHELGHVLGLGHSPFDTGLMAAQRYPSNEPEEATDGEVAAVVELYGWGAE